MYNKNSTPAGYGGYLQGQGSNGQSMSGMGQVGPGFDQSSGLPGMTSGLPAVQGGSFGTSMPGTSMTPEMMASQQYQSEYRQLAAQRDQLQSMLNIGFPQQMSQGTGEYMNQAQINQNYSSQSGQEYSALDLPGRGRSPPRSLLDLRTYSPPPARGDMYARGGDRRDDRYEDDAHGGDRRDDVYQDDARGGDRRDDRYEDDVRGGDRRDDRYEDDVRGGDRRDDRYEDDDIYDPSFPSGTSPETDYRRGYVDVDRGEYDDVSNRSKRKLIVEYGTDSSKRTRVVDSYYEDFDQQPDRQMDSLQSITDSGQSTGGKTRVYFGNITRSTTSRDIKKLLEGTSGVLEVVIAHHVNPHTYKTGAFIEMATPNEAVTIIEEFKGVFYNDGPLLVRLARAHDYENMKLYFNDEAGMILIYPVLEVYSLVVEC